MDFVSSPFVTPSDSVKDLWMDVPRAAEAFGGWLVLTKFNSTNALGGFTGLKSYMFRIRDGEITLLHDPI